MRSASPSTMRPHRLLPGLSVLVLVVAALYFGRPVLLPLALAVLFTFLLRPAVLWLERRRLPRIVAVCLVVVAIFTSLGVTGWIVTYQISDLVLHLDDYRGEIRTKIRAFNGGEPGVFDKVRDTMEEVSEEIEESEEESRAEEVAEEAAEDVVEREQAGEPARGADPPKAPVRRDPRGVLQEAMSRMTERPGEEQFDGDAAEDAPPPLPVQVVPPPASPADALGVVLQTLAAPIATAALVVVLVIFMLIGFEDLRNRLVRLAGEGRVSMTTKTLDDAGKRISSYLLMNALVNGGFGLIVFLGLLSIGVHYAALWGFMAAALRFVPYVGPITAAVLPVALSVIQFPDWTHPLLTVGLFVVLELITNNVVEPLAYGKSAGVSTVALLVSAAFWTWLWGPMGLVLSVPLTVVLAVLGKHVPQLEGIGVLLGDQPALEPHVSYYQRLLAGDAEEAADIAEEQLAAAPRLEVYDKLFVSALALAERDRQRGDFSDEDTEFLWRTTRELVDENAPEAAENGSPATVRLLACPVQDAADELALAMLSHVLPAHCELEVASLTTLASELLQKIEDDSPQGVVISALGPGGTAQTRYLVKRIRQRFARLPIIVGRWGFQGDRERMAAGLKGRGADHVATTLAEGATAAARIQPLVAAV